ncbi:CRE-SRG-58 protein [Caenorhabditis remanei]|uniref:Serpentine receptor class gamma n=1 Tax=Caenorhabditis remanei TaxID=31234 RepID=E3LL82_CAERE|nr:CRE-SRG-58 protein [Caenorhabditis remanei]
MASNTTTTPTVSIPLTVTASMETVTADTTAQIFTIVQLIYGIPSAGLLIFFFFFLFGKKYSNSFYRLVQFDLLVNFLTYINSWFAVRIDRHPIAIPALKALTYAFPGFLTWTRYFAYFFMHMQFLSAIVLSFHRISSVFLHSQYNKLWNWGLIPFCILCIIYCSACNLLIPGFITEVYIYNGTLTKKMFFSVIGVALNLTGIFSAIYFILLVFVGLATSHLVTRKIQAASFSNGGIGKKLTKIAGTYGIIYSGILIWSCVSALNSNFKFLPTIVSQISSNLLPFASDMMTLALPYILFIHDTNVKQDLWRRKTESRIISRINSTSFVVSR